MKIRLVVLTFEHEKKALEFKQEFFDNIVSSHLNIKNYATEMLRLIKEKARQSGLSTLQFAAERTNYPSIKTILNNGGTFIRSFHLQNGQADIYSIDLSIPVCKNEGAI